MHKKPKLTETAYAIKHGDCYELTGISTYKRNLMEKIASGDKGWYRGAKIVKVKIIEQ